MKAEFSKCTKLEMVRVFSQDLFHLYREGILRELEVLTGHIIGDHSLNNEDDKVMIGDAERKLE